MQTKKLTEELIEDCRQIMNKAELLKRKDLQYLSFRPSTEAWNILECIEHLNLYGDYYLPEIQSRIKKSQYKPEPYFKGGFWGNYFAKSMLPKTKMKKMKTFKDKNPIRKQLSPQVIDKFIHQLHELIALLDASKAVSLNKTKTSISITSLLKLKLGDTFRFLINHMQRHMHQIENLESDLKNKSKNFVTV